jgi:hypothetical protein
MPNVAFIRAFIKKVTTLVATRVWPSWDDDVLGKVLVARCALMDRVLAATSQKKCVLQCVLQWVL